ncbi:hypothetical protein QJQ45_021803, partial [Haematococcus lacustris]
MIDIGCNKGLTSSEWFHMWVPELGINKVSLRNVMVAQHLARGGNPAVTLCHTCDTTRTADGRVVPTKACTEVQHDLGFLAHGLGDLSPGSTLQPRHLTVHCIEPSDINFSRLDEVRQVLMHHAAYRPGVKFGGPLTHTTSGGVGATWLMHNVAMSNVTGEAAFSKACSTTLCQLEEEVVAQGPGTAAGTAPATPLAGVWTVDKLMQDVVGANTSVLLLKLVDFIIFEYNSVGKWRTTLLADVVIWMEQKGYACYFDSQPDIFKLSSGCWLPGYEVHQWRWSGLLTSKRAEAERAAEPTQPTKGKGKAQGKAAKAKPAPQPGRWLDRDCNAALNMQRIGESRWRPLELCYWKLPTPPAAPPWQQLAAAAGAAPGMLTPASEQQGATAELYTSLTRKRGAGGRDRTQHVEEAVALLQTDAAHGVSHAPLRCDPGTAAAQLEIIGCNKGLTSSEWFHMWVPELGINKVSLRNVMVAQHLARGGNPAVTLCHFCDETVTADGRVVPTKACTEVQHDLGFLAHGLGDLSPGSTLQPRHLTVHCIEPSDINFSRLDEVRSQAWLLLTLQMSNVTGEAAFSKACSTTLCQLEEEVVAQGAGTAAGTAPATPLAGVAGATAPAPTPLHRRTLLSTGLSQAGPLHHPLPSDSPLQQQSSKVHGYPARQAGVRSSVAAGSTGLMSAGKAIREGKAGRGGKIHRRQAQGEAGSQAVGGSPAGPGAVMVSPTPSPVEDATYKV